MSEQPIVPNQSIGHLYLRRHVTEYKDELRDWYLEQGGVSSRWCRFVDLYDVAYRVRDIEIGVDVRSGQIHRLTATLGFGGSFGEVRIGMLAGEAMVTDPRIYYDEREEALFVEDCAGIMLEVDADDPDPKLVPTLKIAAISVFAPEAVFDTVT